MLMLRSRDRCTSLTTGTLAYKKKRIPPDDASMTLSIGFRKGPREVRFLVGEVPL
jgi:hypothetical protein